VTFLDSSVIIDMFAGGGVKVAFVEDQGEPSAAAGCRTVQLRALRPV